MNTTDQHIQAILERNQRVEADKAWETSVTRRGCIALLTYGVATVFLWSIGITNFCTHALVPTGGYIFSTLSLPPLKRWWMNKYYATTPNGKA